MPAGYAGITLPQLEDLRTDMESAHSSYSGVLLCDAAGRLKQALALSERIRAVLASVLSI